MIDIYTFISSVGRHSLSTFWFPMGIWTLFAFIVSGILWKNNAIPSAYQFHSRAALLIALPLGIIGSAILNWWSSLGETALPAGLKFIVIQSSITVTPTGVPEAASVPWGDPFLWLGILLGALLVGSLVSVGYLLWNLYQLRSISKQLHFIPVRDVVDDSSFHSSDTNTRIAFTDEISVPFTYGCFQTVIVLPQSLRANPQEMRLAVKHELMHVKHRDFLTNSILSLVRSLFWFHPLTHQLHNESIEHREITCDTEVLSDANVSKKKYARLLYRLATQSNSNNQATISMAVNSSTLKKRIKMMNNQINTTCSYKRSLLFMTMSALLVVGIMSCSDLQNENNNNAPSEKNAVSSEQAPEPSKSDTGNFYVAVEDMPELQGGLKSLQQEINYPEEASENGEEGRVIIQFIVNEQGQVEDPQIVRGVSESLDQEALRVVRQAEFTPGKQDGQPVRVQYSMPVTFQL